MKIKIHKFKTIQDLPIQVPAEITSGNGLGKSTILEAISFCLTGKDLNGKEMVQIYDNRQDLHDAIADVSFFDDYDNEFRRKVQPTFETSRDGTEKLKILRSTKCTRNGIEANDFAKEFQDFFRFGTDYFFSQKESDQRSIFIDLMKSLLPTFDLQKAQLELKALEKTQRETKSEIERLQKELKDTTDVEVLSPTNEAIDLENKYKELIASSSNNQELTAKINSANNALIDEYRTSKTKLEALLDDKERELRGYESKIKDAEIDLENVKNEMLIISIINDVSEFKKKADELRKQLDGLTYFDNVQEFGKLYATQNPIVKQNIDKITALRNGESDDTDVSDVCSACGVASPQALEKSLDIKIGAIKQENRDLLTIDMRASNNDYLSVKDELERIVDTIQKTEAENVIILQKNEAKERSFNINKTNKIESAKKGISDYRAEIVVLTKAIATLKNEISELKEPKLKALPTELTISDELSKAHDEYSELMIKITKAEGVNENNELNKSKKIKEVADNREFMSELDKKIVPLQNEISDYFSNLKDIVEKEFEGKIKIGVQLQEYVITKNEYKDCFKIIANDNIFPSECNGAFLNNVKLQVLRTLQRLKNYSGLTIMDNAEANTTEPLNSEGLNIIVAKAINENQLLIK